MGCDIHITRAECWPESDVTPIKADEWLGLVHADPELAIDKRDNGPYFALWLAHPIDDDHAWFDWFKGRIMTKNPDRKILGKALQIAKALGAKVQRDDGEEYTSLEDLPPDQSGAPIRRSPWWKFW